MNLKAVSDRAEAALLTLRYDPPALNAKAILVIIALIAGAYVWGWWGTASARDQWWRDQISSKSASVRAVVSREGADIDQLDNEILKALGATDGKLAAAERELATARNAVSPDGCPRIPGFCMRN